MHSKVFIVYEIKFTVIERIPLEMKPLRNVRYQIQKIHLDIDYKFYIFFIWFLDFQEQDKDI